MFYYKFFCQTIQCPKKEGGHNVPPSDVSPTKKHADVTRVKCTILEHNRSMALPFNSNNGFTANGKSYQPFC